MTGRIAHGFLSGRLARDRTAVKSGALRLAAVVTVWLSLLFTTPAWALYADDLLTCRKWGEAARAVDESNRGDLVARAEAGEVAAQITMLYALAGESRLAEDPGRAFHYAVMAGEKGNAFAQALITDLIIRYPAAGISAEYAYKMALQSALQGNSMGTLNAGTASMYGRGTPQALDMAFVLLEDARKLGHPAALSELCALRRLAHDQNNQALEKRLDEQRLTLNYTCPETSTVVVSAVKHRLAGHVAEPVENASPADPPAAPMAVAAPIPVAVPAERKGAGAVPAAPRVSSADAGEQRSQLRPEAQLLTLADVQRILAGTRDFTGKSLAGLDLAQLDFSGARLTDANLQRADLYRANFAGADLTRADLRGASLDRADLRGAVLRDVRLNDATLFFARLEHADLEGSQIRRSYAAGSRLAGANLRRANLSGSNFSGASFLGCDLSTTTMDATLLEGAALVLPAAEKASPPVELMEGMWASH